MSYPVVLDMGCTWGALRVWIKMIIECLAQILYLASQEADVKWGISDRRIRVLCSQGKIPGAYQEGRGWIPI